MYFHEYNPFTHNRWGFMAGIVFFPAPTAGELEHAWMLDKNSELHKELLYILDMRYLRYE